MSRGCVLVERQPNKWYCMVAQDEYDYEFNGNYSVYGPESNKNKAYDEMQKRECNPGCSTTYTHDRIPDWVVKLVDEELNRIIKNRR